MKVDYPDGRIIMDREALMLVFRRSAIRHGERTIRKHCRVIGYSPEGRALYDMDACLEALGKVKTRAVTPSA